MAKQEKWFFVGKSWNHWVFTAEPLKKKKKRGTAYPFFFKLYFCYVRRFSFTEFEYNIFVHLLFKFQHLQFFQTLLGDV